MAHKNKMTIEEKFKDKLKVGLGHNTEGKGQYSNVIGYIKSKSGLIGEVSVTIEFDEAEWDKDFLRKQIKVDEE